MWRLSCTAIVLLVTLPGASVARLSAPTLAKYTVEVDGHPLAVWARVPPSPRAALLLVHGRTWSSRPDFDLQVPGMQRSVMASLAARGIAAYAVDLRGYGATPRDATGSLTPRRAADDVAAVVRWVASRHSTLPAPALLGWSQGAAVAHLAAQTPGVGLSALILFGFVFEPGEVDAPLPVPVAPARTPTTRQDALADFVAPDVSEPVMMSAFAQQAVAADPIRMDWMHEEQFNALNPARLTMPTMVLHGARDPGVPTEVARRFFAAIASAERQWTLLPGADHAAQIEATHERFVSAVVEFIVRQGRHR